VPLQHRRDPDQGTERDRVGVSLVRNQPPVAVALAARALRGVAVAVEQRTVEDMPAPMFLSRPLRSRSVAARPDHGLRAPAKTISRVNPAIIVPAATDPAVLVTLGSDLRLRLATLAGKTGVALGDLAVVRLATGCVELAPADTVEAGVLRPLKLDAQRRLRLTAGIAARLCATPGTKLLVTCDPATGRVMAVNLGTFADALEALLADTTDSVDTADNAVAPVEPTTRMAR
jgi:hypothetical protein